MSQISSFLMSAGGELAFLIVCATLFVASFQETWAKR